MEEFGRVPPHNTEAERCVLGAMLLSAQAVSEAVNALEPQDFYLPSNQTMYEAMRKLFAMSRPVDLVTLCDALEKQGALSGLGGPSAVSALVSDVPSTANVGSYIDIVKNHATLRKLGLVGGDITKDAFDARKPAHEILTTAEKAIFDLSQNNFGNALQQIHPSVYTVYERIVERFENKGTLSGLPSGFRDLDYKLSGLNNSDLLIVAARPAMGKTSFMLNIVLNVAQKSNMPVAVFSLEMAREQLVNRLLGASTGVSLTRMRSGELQDSDWEKIMQGIEMLGPLPIYIDDTPSISPMEVLSKCRHLKAQNKLGLVIIDYLQLMRGNTKTDNRVSEISEISRDLKALARELNVPVIAASQLSRAPDQRKDGHRPQLSDLRESGSIEQDADTVMFLYRDFIYSGENENDAEVIVAKQRSGPVGTIKLHWSPELTLFSDASPQWREEY